MSEMIPVSGCIVAYHNCGEILECLSALKAQTKGVSLSLFVSDNGSDDGTPAAVRAAFPEVKKVTSSRTKKKTEILSESPLEEQKLKDAISATGYTPGSVTVEEAKKGFSLFRR